MQDCSVLAFPVVGEISETAWDQVAEGQPVLLLRNGRPVAVIVDLESWEEAEVAVSQGA
jgi:PHD/YefM family antitoxin component YafN of YafNO toxin-antitoxin module